MSFETRQAVCSKMYKVFKFGVDTVEENGKTSGNGCDCLAECLLGNKEKVMERSISLPNLI